MTVLAVVLGLSALGVPTLSISGIAIWLKRRTVGQARIHNHSLRSAEIVILVGSEGNATWGFAATLHGALMAAGRRVHTTTMNRISKRHLAVQHLIVLTSTYGDGRYPATASRFIERLSKLKTRGNADFTVLGFGDKQFSQFCRFAKIADAALSRKGLPQLLELDLVDQQCPIAFNRWGRMLGARLGIAMDLNHAPEMQKTDRMVLLDCVTRSDDNEAPIAVFRFALPENNRKRRFKWSSSKRSALPKFSVGDFLGIVPPGSTAPRYYSLASSSDDGFAEICVKRQTQGLCSTFLHGLQNTDVIDCFIKPNPSFRPDSSTAPVLMIGAGTGIAPLAGFVRKNVEGRPMHLYWGGRTPHADFVYRDTVMACLNDRRLATIASVFSRSSNRQYVQDRLREDAAIVRSLVEDGAQILVCGGRDMASGVRKTIDDILQSSNLTVSMLKRQQRYLEDVY